MSKTPTPRTDAESLSGQGKAGRCYVSVNFARQLETELNEAKETNRLLTTDVNYVGGIQCWQKQHHEALVAGFLALRAARANAFDEAADIVLNAKWQKGSMNYNQGFISGELKAKADQIRKGEEK